MGKFAGPEMLIDEGGNCSGYHSFGPEQVHPLRGGQCGDDAQSEKVARSCTDVDGQRSEQLATQEESLWEAMGFANRWRPLGEHVGSHSHKGARLPTASQRSNAMQQKLMLKRAWRPIKTKNEMMKPMIVLPEV